MRSTWTDSRLDDLATNTDRRFDELERRMESGFTRVDGELREIRGELSGINRSIVQLSLAVGGGFAAFGAALLGLIATQL